MKLFTSEELQKIMDNDPWVKDVMKVRQRKLEELIEAEHRLVREAIGTEHGFAIKPKLSKVE